VPRRVNRAGALISPLHRDLEPWSGSISPQNPAVRVECTFKRRTSCALEGEMCTYCRLDFERLGRAERKQDGGCDSCECPRAGVGCCIPDPRRVIASILKPGFLGAEKGNAVESCAAPLRHVVLESASRIAPKEIQLPLFGGRCQRATLEGPARNSRTDP